VLSLPEVVFLFELSVFVELGEVLSTLTILGASLRGVILNESVNVFSDFLISFVSE